MFPHFLYGGDYNPDQWPEAVWEEDARLMQEAGVNLASVGIFSWARLEPQAGVYDFEWLDRVIDLPHAHGVGIDLATPTASPPPWLVQRDPTLLPITADGVRLGLGSRRHICPHNATYREYAARIVTQLATRYRNHPALRLWHLDNEYACHVSECYCEASAQAFRQWLQARYGTMAALNEAWGTAFWSQHYNDWQEIEPPRRTPTFVNPSERLDWQRFCSDSWLECFEEQRAILREITPDVPITTNFMGFFWPLNYWQWAAREDIVANDAYPETSDPGWMVGSALVCDLIRSLRQGQPWLLMEQAPAHVNWRERNSTKRPGVMRLGSYQAIARGANGVMFFQWRAARFGAEKFHSAMVPHGGTETRVWREVRALGAELQQLDAVLPGRVPAEVAILFDWENWWAFEQEGRPLNDLHLLPSVSAWHAELYKRGIAVDFAQPEADLSRYRLVIAPHLYLLTARGADNLKQYVSGGGVLLLSFFSGIADEHDQVWLGGYPALLQDLLGMHVEEFAPYGAASHTNEVATADGRRFGCREWSDVIQLHGAEPLAAYQHDYYAGSPAVTRHGFGQGAAYYVGTQLDAAGMGWLLERVCAEANATALAKLPGVEIVERRTETHAWLFVLNYTDQPAEVPLPRAGQDLITGKAVGGSLVIEPAGVAIIESALA